MEKGEEAEKEDKVENKEVEGNQGRTQKLLVDVEEEEVEGVEEVVEEEVEEEMEEEEEEGEVVLGNKESTGKKRLLRTDMSRLQ